MSSTTLTSVTQQDFDQRVLHSDTVQLVEFTAEWCPPCKAIVPSLEAIARDYQGKVSVFQVDVDSQQAIAERYGIRAMPTLLLFRDGRVVDQLVGAASKSVIEGKVQRVLQSRA